MATAPLSSSFVRNRPVSAQRLYEKLGWSVIPVDCSIFERSADGTIHWRKPALVPWRSYMARRADESEIAEWRRQFPNAGIAVVCGAISNLLVLDADGAAGVAEAERRGLPETPTVRTPNGGLHAYFRAVPGLSFRNGAKLGDTKKIDVRSDNGYVAAPYSMRGDGKRYEWLKHPERVKLAEPPEWFLQLLNAAGPTLRAPLSVKAAPGSGVRLVSGSGDRQGSTGGGGGSFLPWIRKLPDFAQKLIQNGHNLDRYTSRSECDLDVVTLLVCVGAPFEIVEGIFQNYPIGEKYNESGEGTRYLEKTAEVAFRSVKTVRVKYADLREYDVGACGKRLHVALDEGDGQPLIRTGLTVPTSGNIDLAVRWQHFFGACKVRVPGSTKDEIELAARSVREKRIRILYSARRENPVVGFYAI